MGSKRKRQKGPRREQAREKAAESITQVRIKGCFTEPEYLTHTVEEYWVGMYFKFWGKILV